MNVIVVSEKKKEYLDLLLLADEQESMIDRYLQRGTLFALYDGDVLKSIAVVTQEDESTYEIKNLATYEKYQRQGCARFLVNYLIQHYKSIATTITVGTGDDSETVDFYKKCGFEPDYVVKAFFVDNYDHPIMENGRQIKDMLYLKRKI